MRHMITVDGAVEELHDWQNTGRWIRHFLNISDNRELWAWTPEGHMSVGDNMEIDFSEVRRFYTKRSKATVKRIRRLEASGFIIAFCGILSLFFVAVLAWGLLAMLLVSASFLIASVACIVEARTLDDQSPDERLDNEFETFRRGLESLAWHYDADKVECLVKDALWFARIKQRAELAEIRGRFPLAVRKQNSGSVMKNPPPRIPADDPAPSDQTEKVAVYQKALNVALGAVKYGGDHELVAQKVADILSGKPSSIVFAEERGGAVIDKQYEFAVEVHHDHGESKQTVQAGTAVGALAKAKLFYLEPGTVVTVYRSDTPQVGSKLDIWV